MTVSFTDLFEASEGFLCVPYTEFVLIPRRCRVNLWTTPAIGDLVLIYALRPLTGLYIKNLVYIKKCALILQPDQHYIFLFVLLRIIEIIYSKHHVEVLR